jgi:hypothetical protein
VVAEWLTARREADADPYVAYGNDEGFVDLGTSRSMFMIDQPNLAATCGLDASGASSANETSVQRSTTALYPSPHAAGWSAQASWAVQQRRTTWQWAPTRT